jgi:hypothetical protein
VVSSLLAILWSQKTLVRGNKLRPSFHWPDHLLYVIPDLVRVAFEPELNHVSDTDELKCHSVSLQVAIGTFGSVSFVLCIAQSLLIGGCLEKDDPFLTDTPGGSLAVHDDLVLEQQFGCVSLSSPVPFGHDLSLGSGRWSET